MNNIDEQNEQRALVLENRNEKIKRLTTNIKAVRLGGVLFILQMKKKTFWIRFSSRGKKLLESIISKKKNFNE